MADDRSDASASKAAGDGAYQVLARKYRPSDFKDLIGQEAMVRTLRNAFESDRIAHAFVLTGVRGVGKTTTARIIAKGLNCIGPDGQGGPTVEPCGVCEHCVSIAASRHVDVLEMDAASRTGVGDIREIIDGVRYRAASARYKVYIIDEVHMLSTNAFNALLKTLEEPPAHVKFLFATTEIRKVPVTVLSRCQRFDLRRIEPEVMMAHLAGLCGKENAAVAEDALALITRAAEGSVRDALSLLDQAIAHGAGETSADQVRDMLGLADRGRVLDLFEAVMRGDCAAALEELAAQYAAGADPLAVLRDLAEATHWVSMVKISPESADDPTIPPEERERGRELAGKLGMRPLTRMWQMLLKAMEEVGQAPNAMMAAEMAMIRLTHVADLPSPEEIIRRFETSNPDGPGAGPGGAPAGGAPTGGGGGGGMRPSGMTHAAPAYGAPMAWGAAMPTARSTLRVVAGGAPDAAAKRQEGPKLDPAAAEALAKLPDFDAVLALIKERRDARLLVEVERGVRLISYAPGRIEYAPTEKASKTLAQDMALKLQGWTGARWIVSIGSGPGAPSVAETRDAAMADLTLNLSRHPLVAAALAAFPGAEIKTDRRMLEADPGAEPDAQDPGAVSDAWDDWDPVDPFDDEPI